MTDKTLDKIKLKLKAPMQALKKSAQGKKLSKIFAEVSVMELKEALELLNGFKSEAPAKEEKSIPEV